MAFVLPMDNYALYISNIHMTPSIEQYKDTRPQQVVHCSFIDASQLPMIHMLVVYVCKKTKDHQVGAHKTLKCLWVHQVEFAWDMLKEDTLWHKWCVDVDWSSLRRRRRRRRRLEWHHSCWHDSQGPHHEVRQI
jgi:hypothetical protein